MFYISILIFLVNGVVTLETKTFPSLDACMKDGMARITRLELDPKVTSIEYGSCLPSALKEVSRSGNAVFGF